MSLRVAVALTCYLRQQLTEGTDSVVFTGVPVHLARHVRLQAQKQKQHIAFAGN